MTSIITITGLPSITGISPSSGSTNGGTLVTITGNGFSSKTTVTIGNSQCNVVSVEVNKLQCFTTAKAEGEYSVTIRFKLYNLPFCVFKTKYFNISIFKVRIQLVIRTTALNLSMQVI